MRRKESTLDCSIVASREEFVIRNSQNEQNGVDDIASGNLKYRIRRLDRCNRWDDTQGKTMFQRQDIEMQASRKEVSPDASLIVRISTSIGKNNDSDIITRLCKTSFVLEPWWFSHSSIACLQRRL
jgi:hypothetical protein